MIVCKLDEILKEKNIKPSVLLQNTSINKDVLSRMRHNNVSGCNMDLLDQMCTFLNCQLGDIFEYIPDKEK